jgi:hypothetical protein
MQPAIQPSGKPADQSAQETIEPEPGRAEPKPSRTEPRTSHKIIDFLLNFELLFEIMIGISAALITWGLWSDQPAAH